MEANPTIHLNGLFVGQMINIPDRSRTKHCICKAELKLRNKMRLLWEQHVAWTRMTIISIVFNLPDVNFVSARLLQNAPDMGNSLRPYYGDHAAKTYTTLIREHLVIAADLVKAANAGNAQAAADLERKWYANGEQIVQFLSRYQSLYIEKRI